MAITPDDFGSTSSLINEATNEAQRDLESLQRHICVAAERTKGLDISVALEWSENYLNRVGIPVPSKLSKFLQIAWGDGEVGEPLHNEPIDLASDKGAWGDLLADGGFNLIVAAPKVGKSALMIHLFACAKRGEQTCLGARIRKPWNKLIINGCDMSAGQWGKLLLREGLATHIPDPSNPDAPGKYLPDSDVLIWDQRNPARMSEKGIAAMRAKCLEHPDSLLIIDSLRSNVDPSIDENKAEIRGPIEQTKEGLADCCVTVALIHHANKSVSGSTAISAAAGSNAISGACDGTILLKHLQPESVAGFRSDNRIVASSSGRLQNDRVLIELTQEGIGEWIAHEDVEDAMRAEGVYEMEERLTSRQNQLYEHAEEIAENGVHMTVKEAMAQFNLTRQKAYKTLEQLARKGLLTRCGTLETGLPGKEFRLYAPTLSDLARVGIKKRGVLNILKIHTREESGLEPHEPHEPLHSAPRAREGVQDQLPEVGTPVQLLRDGAWQNGWKLHKDSTPHNVSVWRIAPNGSLLKLTSKRWGVDVRLCVDPPLASQDQTNSPATTFDF